MAKQEEIKWKRRENERGLGKRVKCGVKCMTEKYAFGLRGKEAFGLREKMNFLGREWEMILM